MIKHLVKRKLQNLDEPLTESALDLTSESPGHPVTWFSHLCKVRLWTLVPADFSSHVHLVTRCAMCKPSAEHLSLNEGDRCGHGPHEMLRFLLASAPSMDVLRPSFALDLESQDFQGSLGRSLSQEPGPIAGTVILISDSSVIGWSGCGDQKYFLGETWPSSNFCGSRNTIQIRQPLRVPTREAQWELTLFNLLPGCAFA